VPGEVKRLRWLISCYRYCDDDDDGGGVVAAEGLDQVNASRSNDPGNFSVGSG